MATSGQHFNVMLHRLVSNWEEANRSPQLAALEQITDWNIDFLIVNSSDFRMGEEVMSRSRINCILMHITFRMSTPSGVYRLASPQGRSSNVEC